jgi:hypothetical protein
MNPEFRRNLWLELTLHRLVAMPAVLALVLALVYAASDEGAANVAMGAAVIAGALLGIWGSRNAVECVAEEVRARTWDGQRMSAIGPWAMTWGKLLGTTAFAWYGGLIALAVLLAVAPEGWARSPLRLAALLAASGLLLQAVACLGGLAVARKGYARRGASGGWALILILFVFGPGMLGFFSDAARPVQWWGGRFAFDAFLLGSVSVFAAWAVFGVYRSMAAELQVRTLPWAFAAFILFLTAYFAGFWVHGGESALGARNAILVWGLLMAAALTYLQLFGESTGVIVFRRVQVRLQRGEWRRALEEMPCWPVGVVLAGLFAVLGALLLEVPPRAGSPLHGLAGAPLALFLLLARDAAIFLVFAFARQPRRAEAATLFYLVMLYGILPGLLVASDLEGLAQLVLPPVLAAPGKAAAIAAAHAAIACALVAWRWRVVRNLEGKPLA